ncbi:MAG TPA: selenide, water dikinase SelD, partial [Anaerolineales bacterium]|nr:selenide, water dikinase SelD [Anaerolineales bacterium]
QVLRPIKDIFDPALYPDLLIGLESPDDAAVWRLSEDKAIVVTTDFFTPVVDTAYEYGAIAAANSLSDVYAMGGVPFLALNIAALPDNLPTEISTEILRGGAEKAREAGVVIAGGHTVKDKEPKYGLVVIGFVDPRKMISKGGLKLGDVLVLTKPLGFGVTTTALKQEKASASDVREAIEWMSRLNKTAAELAVEFGVRGGTDVTGFGLLGHGVEMAEASGVLLYFENSKLPFLSGARGYAEKGIFPGGAFDNKGYFEKHVKFDEKLDEPAQMLLFDPQTSGGLLLGVPREKLKAFETRAKELSQPVWVVGEVRAGHGIEARS